MDRENVLARIAVTQRARSAGIVADHAADGCARGGRDIDRKPQSVRLEPAIELVEDNARLDGAAFARNIERDDLIEIFRAVDDEGRIDGLPGLRSTGASRQHAHALVAGKRKRAFRLLDG